MCPTYRMNSRMIWSDVSCEANSPDCCFAPDQSFGCRKARPICPQPARRTSEWCWGWPRTAGCPNRWSGKCSWTWKRELLCNTCTIWSLCWFEGQNTLLTFLLQSVSGICIYSWVPFWTPFLCKLPHLQQHRCLSITGSFWKIAPLVCSSIICA